EAVHARRCVCVNLRTGFLLAHCGGGQDKPGCLGPSAERPGSFLFRLACPSEQATSPPSWVNIAEPSGGISSPMVTDTKTALGAREVSSAPSELEQAVAAGERDPFGTSNEIAVEGTHENAGTGISLLELAEILDQHKAWAESGGEN